MATSINEQSDTRKKAMQSQEFKDAISVDSLADKLGVDKSLIIDDFNMTELEKQKNVYLKEDLSDTKTIKKVDKKRIDDVSASSKDKAKEVIDGVKVWRTKNWMGNETVHIKSDYLGDFEYSPDDFTLGYKEIKEADGSTSKLPVLEYTGSGDGQAGWHTDNFLGMSSTGGVDLGSDPKIPKGLKVADYMFTGNKNMVHVPKMPNSVISMHCTFKDCKNLKEAASDAYSLPPDHIATFANYYNLPDKLQNMSYAFAGCDKLVLGFPDEASKYEGMPQDLRNIRDAWEGCEEIGKKGSCFFGWVDYQYKIPGYGGVTTPYLTSHYAEDALNKITSEDVKDKARNTEFLINDDGSVNEKVVEDIKNSDYFDEYKAKLLKEGKTIDEKTGLDKDTLDESKTHTGINHQKDIYDGKVSTNSQINSNGQLTDNYVYDDSRQLITNDNTGLMKSDEKPKESFWERLAIDGAAGFGIAGVFGKITKNKWVGLAAGVGGAYALDKFNVLPESFSPILRFTANLLPEGSWKDKLNELADKSGRQTINEQKKLLTDENVTTTNMYNRLSSSVFSVDSADVQSLNKSMYNNGKECGASMTFKALADIGEKGTSGITDVVGEATNAMEDRWATKFKDKTPTEDDKKLMREYYTRLVEGLSEYNKGAKEGFATLPADYKTASQEGLKMANRAYTKTTLDSLKAMDGQYHFMDDATWSKLDSYSIDGCGKLSEYSAEKYAEYEAASVAIVDGLKSHATYVVGKDVRADLDAIKNGTYKAEDTKSQQTSTENKSTSDSTEKTTKDRSVTVDNELNIDYSSESKDDELNK